MGSRLYGSGPFLFWWVGIPRKIDRGLSRREVGNLPAAPDVPVQIAHLTGSGGYDDATDAAVSVFTDAIAKHDVRMKNVWFDAAVVVRPNSTPDQLKRIAARIRQIGVKRILYGSDAASSP